MTKLSYSIKRINTAVDNGYNSPLPIAVSHLRVNAGINAFSNIGVRGLSNPRILSEAKSLNLNLVSIQFNSISSEVE
jgi:hypothetical protein